MGKILGTHRENGATAFLTHPWWGDIQWISRILEKALLRRIMHEESKCTGRKKEFTFRATCPWAKRSLVRYTQRSIGHYP